MDVRFGATFQPQTQFGAALGNLASSIFSGPSPLQVQYLQQRLALSKARTQEILERRKGRQELSETLQAMGPMADKFRPMAAIALRRGIDPGDVARAMRLAAGNRDVTDRDRAAAHVAAGRPIRPKDSFSLGGAVAGRGGGGGGQSPAGDQTMLTLDKKAESLPPEAKAQYNYWRRRGRPDKAAEVLQKAGKSDAIDLRRNKVSGATQSRIAGAIMNRLNLPRDPDKKGIYKAPDGTTYTRDDIARMAQRGVEIFRKTNDLNGAVTGALRGDSPLGVIDRLPETMAKEGAGTTPKAAAPKPPSGKAPRAKEPTVAPPKGFKVVR